MKKWWITNIALLAVAGVLAWVAYLASRGREPQQFPLSTLAAAAVSHIRLERTGSAPLVLERTGNRWRITAPFSAPADPFQVQRLLAILDARATHRLGTGDLARFDLDPPRMRLSLDETSFGFGAVNSATREQYVLTGGVVYTVEPRYGSALPVNAEDLVQKRLFEEDEVPVRFELEGFVVAKDSEHGWRVSPSPADLSRDDVNRWVENWRQAFALRAEPSADGGKPSSEISIELAGGKRLALGIVQREPELVLVHPERRLRYYFAPSAAARLLAPPGARKPEK